MKDVVFLLGAGASVPAKLPSMPELTMKYYEHVEQQFLEDEKEAIQVLREIMQNTPSPRNDIEGLMSMIRNLDNVHYKFLATSKFSKLDDLNPDLLGRINDKTQKFIRKSLEQNGSYEYLSPLEGFLDSNPTEIFTLNYDGMVDLFCEKYGIKYVDGFSPYWDPTIFDDLTTDIKLYRLHGCLYWFKTSSGKHIRIPLVGLDLETIRHISSEKLSEIIIYPNMNKEKYSKLYSWLNTRFIKSLHECKLLIVVGYSFRDDDITSIIKDALLSRDMWLLIISPDARTITGDQFDFELNVKSRILRLPQKFEEVLKRGSLFEGIKKLLLLFEEEKEALKRYHQTEEDNVLISPVIDGYLSLNCEERLMYLKNAIHPFYSEEELEKLFRDAYTRKKENSLENSLILEEDSRLRHAWN